MPVAQWTPYIIRIPNRSGRRPGDGVVLKTVHHVVHVPTARRILEDGRLRAGLIHDESRLNKSRTCVTWVSANTWGPGSIYGNVQFSFAWLDLIRDRHFYWVEAMTEYSPPAYRILVTDRELGHSQYLTPYDPSTNKGPLREREGTWYWNSDYTSEFMIDSDLRLQRCTAFDFIGRNADKCRLNGSNCPDRAASTYRIGGRVLAFLLGNDLHCLDRVLQIPSPDKRRMLSDAVDVGIDGIIRALGNQKGCFGGAIRTLASGQAVLRGALALYGADQKPSALELIALLKSKEVFDSSLIEIVNAHFRTTGWTLPT
jgi:hypothetical protein